MANYTERQALDQAVELIKTAISAGLIDAVAQGSLVNPQAQGERVAEFIGAAVVTLKKKLEAL